MKALAGEFKPVEDRKLILEMKEKLAAKFSSVKHAGPKDVSDFLDLIDEEEIEMVKRDAYEQVQALLRFMGMEE